MKRLLLAGTVLLAAACTTPTQTARPRRRLRPAAPLPRRPRPAAPAAAAAPAALQPGHPPRPLPRLRRRRRAYDYSKGDDWLCRPGIANDPCEVDLDTTVVKADGSTTIEKFKSDPNAPIDCFYVYPDRVDWIPFTYSDLVPDPEEINVVKAQLARFGSHCRIYAPMYRQFSLGALRARTSAGRRLPSRGNAG